MKTRGRRYVPPSRGGEKGSRVLEELDFRARERIEPKGFKQVLPGHKTGLNLIAKEKFVGRKEKRVRVAYQKRTRQAGNKRGKARSRRKMRELR